MSWEQRNKDFSKAQADAQMAYIEAEREVKRLESENAKLWELVRHMNTCLEHYEPDGSVGCEHCPLNNDAGNCDYERRMHELEVGE